MRPLFGANISLPTPEDHAIDINPELVQSSVYLTPCFLVYILILSYYLRQNLPGVLIHSAYSKNHFLCTSCLCDASDSKIVP